MENHIANKISSEEKWYEIFCGSYNAMKMIASNGAKALNRKTKKFQIIDKKAKYKIEKDSDSDILYILKCNKNLRKIAENKNLILN